MPADQFRTLEQASWSSRQVIPQTRRKLTLAIQASKLSLSKQVMSQPSTILSSSKTKAGNFAMGTPAGAVGAKFQQSLAAPLLLVSLLVLSSGCFQQRYEPANWESTPRKVASKPKVTRPDNANTSLPDASRAAGKDSGGTTLPSSAKSNPSPAKSNGTLPGRSPPPRRGLGNNAGNLTLPGRLNPPSTTLPGRNQTRPGNSTTLPGRNPARESGTTLPQRTTRPALPSPGGNSNQTLPRRR